MPDQQHPAFLPFLVSELVRLRQEKRSGTLFATTMNQRLAQFGLDQGEVVYLSFQALEGVDGLIALAEQRTDLGASRFADGRHRGARLDLPPFDQLLQTLLPTARRPAREGSTPLDDHVRFVVEQELTELIGPYADVVCQDVWERADSLEKALIEIAREINDPAKSEKLHIRVRKALG